MTISHKFSMNKGWTDTEGAKLYPNYLILYLDRQDAFEIVRTLISQLSDNEIEVCRLFLLGKLETFEEDNE